VGDHTDGIRPAQDAAHDVEVSHATESASVMPIASGYPRRRTLQAPRWLSVEETSLPQDDSFLTFAERSALDRLRSDRQRARRRLTRYTTKLAVLATHELPVTPSNLRRIEITSHPSGAPSIAVAGESLKASVSMSARAGVGLCVVLCGDADVGCDVEAVRVISEPFRRSYFTAAEQRIVSSVGASERNRTGAIIWSAKESALKALGTGLRRDPRSVEVRLSDGQSPDWLGLSATVGDLELGGWFRIESGRVLTVVASDDVPAPVPLR
jgi:4'-phosphopantetheinyl transferase